MRRTFERLAPILGGARGAGRMWLQATGAVLALFNGIALFMYLDPPGGTRAELIEQGRQVRSEIAATRAKATRLKTVSEKVQVGSTESGDFENKYFLPKRAAYEEIISEVQRMAQASGMQERDGVFSEEPIEGTEDLSLLNNTANYEGTYENLMRFLYEVDHSPMLLMLDSLQAAPQQKASQINVSIRFQTVVKEEPVLKQAGVLSGDAQ